MSVTQQYRATIQKLKKRVRDLTQKEAQGRKKLKSAMTEARKVARSYKSRLHAKVSGKKAESVYDRASAYASAAMEMERKMLQAAEKKGKAFANAIMQIDKEYITKLVRSVAGMARKSVAARKNKSSAAGKGGAVKKKKKR